MLRASTGLSPILLPAGVAIAVCLALGSPSALAFHENGVGACSVCHVMHDSQDGQPVLGGPGDGAGALLRYGSSSDVCLSCHADAFGHVLGNNPLAPPPQLGAGNFVFLLEDNLNDGSDGLVRPIPGAAAGHNIQAPGFGLGADPYRLQAPGGSYPAGQMGCTSCHDPHGNDNFRMLRGAGFLPDGYQFIYDAPVAEGLDLAGSSETNSSHTAYISGMSTWCANCHLDYYLNRHNLGISSFRHRSDSPLRPGMVVRYNTYNGTADPAGGTEATAYLAAVPFEDPGNTTSRTAGATLSSQAMCLTCHRAHATSAPASLRWDPNVSELGSDGVVSGSYPLPNPYGDPSQERLCAKCHPGGSN